MSLYADVVVPRHFARPFTYLVPETLRATLHVGDAVLVPFGAVTVRGLVVDVRPTDVGVPELRRVRAIIGLSCDEGSAQVDGRLLDLARWIAQHYLASLGQCLRLILPPAGAPGRVERYVATEKGIEALAVGRALSEIDRQLVQRLTARPGGTFKELRKAVPNLSRARVTSAMEQGWIRTSVVAPPAPSNQIETSDSPADVHVSACQLPKDDPIPRSRIERKTFSASLFEAQADRRLAVMLAGLEAAVAASRNAIVLAPEVRRAATIWGGSAGAMGGL